MAWLTKMENYCFVFWKCGLQDSAVRWHYETKYTIIFLESNEEKKAGYIMCSENSQISHKSYLLQIP
jgi:hypothetical protein